MPFRNNIFFISGIILTVFLWIFIVPLWHYPDEQAHFAQSAYFAETGSMPQGSEPDVTKEVYESERLLGTLRDKTGRNQFTFNPSYRIEYSEGYFGIDEEYLTQLSKTDEGRQMVYKEATRYPPAYYVYSGLIYRIFYSSDLFVRVFALRIFSALLYIITVFIYFRSASVIFGRKSIFVLPLTILIAFMPMNVFANTGVNSDVLGNLFFSAFLYSGLILIKRGISLKGVVFLIASGYASYAVKPQFIVVFPMMVFAILLSLRLSGKLKIALPFTFTVFSGLVIWAAITGRLGATGTLLKVIIEENAWASFLRFTYEYSIPHMYREVMPWYWGIYNWLGVTYPRFVHRIINFIVYLSVLGFFVSLVKDLLNKVKLEAGRQLLFLLGGFTLFTSGIFYFDWLSWYRSGFQLGVQGRYFLPFIILQMWVLLRGFDFMLKLLIGKKNWAVVFLPLLMLVLNMYALWTVAQTYYDVSSLKTFLIQASQYKPYFVKDPVIFAVIILALFSNLILFTWLFRFFPKEKNSFHL